MNVDPAAVANATGEEDALVEVADKPREPTPYEKKLRTEARQHRLRATEAERQRDEQVAAARAESERLVAAERAAASERIVRAELKAHAIKAGIVDLDGLRLLDLSGVKLNDAGEVEGSEALVAKFKEAKPWLFEQPSSASTAKPPPEQKSGPKSARDMTEVEYAQAKRAMGIRR